MLPLGWGCSAEFPIVLLATDLPCSCLGPNFGIFTFCLDRSQWTDVNAHCWAPHQTPQAESGWIPQWAHPVRPEHTSLTVLTALLPDDGSTWGLFSVKKAFHICSRFTLGHCLKFNPMISLPGSPSLTNASPRASCFIPKGYISVGAWKMTQWLRMPTALQRTAVWLPAPTSGG